jgi:NADPH:quinone reductase-like Zn-dependent oxidoreductase
MMKAAQYTVDKGDISVVDTDVPAPKKGEVLLRVVAAAVNPIDNKVHQGALKGVWALPLPMTPGYDVSGVVAAVGDNVDSFSVGDAAFAVIWGEHSHDAGERGGSIGGAFAEYVAVPVSKLSHKPSTVSHVHAASVALVGTTATQALTQLNVHEGSKLLVLGGSSAVGAVATQLAKLRGAWVATTCSSRTLEYAKRFGADLHVDYRACDWANDVAELKGVDAVLDTTGEVDGFAKAKTILKADGAFISIASADAGFDPAAHAPLRFAAFTALSNEVKVQDDLAQLLADGKLRVEIDSIFHGLSTASVRALFDKQASGQSMGKNVLVL